MIRESQKKKKKERRKDKRKKKKDNTSIIFAVCLCPCEENAGVDVSDELSSTKKMGYF